jgi:hypothetical protein
MGTAKKSAAAAKEKKPGVGDLAIELLRAGKSNEDVLAAVSKKFPDSSVSISSISWYRNKLRSDGEKVPTARDVKKKAKAAKASAKK